MQRFLLLVDRISTWVGHAFAWCIVVLTAAICYEVVARKVFSAPTKWAFDASYMLYGALFVMAGAYAMARNAHVRGDFLYRAWRPRVQAGMDLVLYFLFFFPGIVAFIYAGFIFAEKSWEIGEYPSSSPDPLLPIYPFKALIPITGVLMFLQGIAEVIRCVLCLRTGQWPQRLHDVEELDKLILEQHRQAEEGGAR
jgi:TRAP-type mannitol/chloroaromatic compound transport system permease small subunit